MDKAVKIFVIYLCVVASNFVEDVEGDVSCLLSLVVFFIVFFYLQCPTGTVKCGSDTLCCRNTFEKCCMSNRTTSDAKCCGGASDVCCLTPGTSSPFCALLNAAAIVIAIRTSVVSQSSPAPAALTTVTIVEPALPRSAASSASRSVLQAVAALRTRFAAPSAARAAPTNAPDHTVAEPRPAAPTAALPKTRSALAVASLAVPLRKAKCASK